MSVVLRLPSGGLIKILFSGLHSQSFQYSKSGLEPKLCISNKFPGETDAASLGTTLWEPLAYASPLNFDLF